MRLIVNRELCRGCRICELACSFFNFGVFNPKKSRIRVTKLEEPGIDIPVVCRQCEKCRPITDCPAGALKKDEETGAVIVDLEKCTGCGICLEACPFGAVSLNPENGLANVCNMCNGSPKCVEWCPNEALLYTRNFSVIGQKKRVEYAEMLAKPNLRRWSILKEV